MAYSFVHGTFVGHDPTLLLSSLQGPLSALARGSCRPVARLRPAVELPRLLATSELGRKEW